MRDVKKILEYRSKGWSQRSIEADLHRGRKSISEAWQAQDEKNISWEQIKNLSEYEVQNLLFGEEVINVTLAKSDFEYIHKELLKPGTTLKLLWEEYADSCRSAHKPF